jgi:predicted DNA-binding transcriptional regulator YafY
VCEDEDGLTISLWLKGNYELVQRVLFYGDRVQVLQPTWLAEQVKEIADSIQAKYLSKI